MDFKAIFRFVLLLSAVIVYLVSAHSSADIVVNEVSRSIELSSHISIHNVFLRISSTNGASEFIYTLTSAQNEKLSLFQAFDDKGILLNVTQLPGQKTTQSGVQYVERKITLRKKLTSSPTSLKVFLVFTKAMVPSPKIITQSQTQLVLYEDSHHLLASYSVLSQTTQFKVPSRIESFTDLKPSSQSGTTLRFGPYENIEPLSQSRLVLHIENNLPFINIKSLLKEYEVSHWGNLAVEETYHIQHIGAQLDGTFSRYDYMRSPSPTAVGSFNFHIPKQSRDWYYRDEIGNISSSQVSIRSSETRLQIVPRFVLFGGWQTMFYLGYNLPLQNYLSTYISDPTRHLLNVSFGISLDEPYSIDDHTVRVILPEGASDIRVSLPFEVDTQSLDDKHYTYLDTSGRPVVYLHKKNTVMFHNQPIEITYSFSQALMLKEPLLLTVAFLVLLLSVVFFLRIDLTIVPRAHQKVE